MHEDSVVIIIHIVVGLFLIILGLYVHYTKAYHLIAGYNTLPPEKKKKIDIRKFSITFRNVFVSMGILIIIVYPLLAFFKLERYVILVSMFIMTLSVVYLLFRGEKYIK